MDKQDRIREEDAIFINTYILSNTEAVISSFHRMTDRVFAVLCLVVGVLMVVLTVCQLTYMRSYQMCGTLPSGRHLVVLCTSQYSPLLPNAR